MRELVCATYDHIWASVYHVVQSCVCPDARAGRTKHGSRGRAVVDHVIVSERELSETKKD